MTDADRERDTDPIGTEPPEPGAIEAKNEMPPPAPLPRESLKPDPNSWEHVQLQTLVEALNASKAALAAIDFDALLAKQTSVFTEIVTARYEMVRDAVLTKLDALGERVGKTESALDAGLKRVDGEIASLRAQFVALEAEVARMKAEASRDATRTAPPPPQPE